jgi:hypothetical protein
MCDCNDVAATYIAEPTRRGSDSNRSATLRPTVLLDCHSLYPKRLLYFRFTLRRGQWMGCQLPRYHLRSSGWHSRSPCSRRIACMLPLEKACTSCASHTSDAVLVVSPTWWPEEYAMDQQQYQSSGPPPSGGHPTYHQPYQCDPAPPSAKFLSAYRK